MLFSSPVFFLFFTFYFFCHLIFPLRWQIPLLIIGSSFFYGFWNPVYVILPFCLTLLGWRGAIWIDSADGKQKFWRLVCTITLLLLPLLFFKYTNFLINDFLLPLVQFRSVSESEKYVDLALPLGISFITFTLISYVVDVYKGLFQIEKQVKWLLGYILFFPQLIAGPILRPSQLLPQLKKNQPRHRRLWITGLTIFTLGLVKKLIFADQISRTIDPIYAAPDMFTSWELWLAVWGFTVQIYCDFSGYTDMAIGLGFLLGVKLPQNFQQPYSAASIGEFWQRWHITLSTWLRDYIYIPLGGSRNRAGKTFRNLMITMLIGGLWHGASWTFVIWGGLHGFFVSLTHLPHWLQAPFRQIPDWIKTGMTVLIVALLWIYFRAENLEVAHSILLSLWSFSAVDFSVFISRYPFPIALLVIFALSHRWDDIGRIRALVKKMPSFFLFPLLFILWLLAITISTGSSADFIYFDF